MLPERTGVNAGSWLLLGALSLGCSRCRSPARESVDGAPARNSATAVGASAGSAAPRAADSALSEEAWVARQVRDIAAASAGTGSDANDAAATSRFLGAFSEADVRAAVGRSGSPKLRFRIAEWSTYPQRLVALSFEPIPFGGDDQLLKPRVTLLEQRNGALAPVAEGRIERQKIHCADRDEPPGGDDRAPDFKLDLGEYAVSPKSVSIGVRCTCFHTSTTEDGSEEFLYLLELTGKRLRQVFEAQIGYTRYTRPTFTDTAGVGVLSIAPGPTKGGYFDLVVRMRVTVDTADPPLHPAAPPSGTHEESQRFSWDGARYRPRGAAAQ